MNANHANCEYLIKMTSFVNVSNSKKTKYIVGKPGKHVFFLFNYSGRLHIEIKSRDAEVFIYGIYIGRGTDNFKLESVQHHLVGQNVSDLLIKGVFFDESKFIYEGLIRIEKKAQKSNAYQKNQNLLMSPKVFVDSRPFLEILANDVRCTHGSTTGRLDAEQIYYLRSRGLDMKKAEKVLIDGFIEDVFNKMEALGYKNAPSLKKNLERIV